jgi:hypothetical protein
MFWKKSYEDDGKLYSLLIHDLNEPSDVKQTGEAWNKTIYWEENLCQGTLSSLLKLIVTCVFFSEQSTGIFLKHERLLWKAEAIRKALQS